LHLQENLIHFGVTGGQDTFWGHFAGDPVKALDDWEREVGTWEGTDRTKGRPKLWRRGIRMRGLEMGNSDIGLSLLFVCFFGQQFCLGAAHARPK